jgi:hypothetical protein
LTNISRLSAKKELSTASELLNWKRITPSIIYGKILTQESTVKEKRLSKTFKKFCGISPRLQEFKKPFKCRNFYQPSKVFCILAKISLPTAKQ